MLILIHQTTPLLNKSLTLSGLQGVCSMGCLLHLLCESAPSNIKIQRTGAMINFFRPTLLPAADLGRWTKPLRG
jgi:hypothetical protein